MTVRWATAVFYALWVAGAGLIIVTWLAWCSHRLKERRRRRIVLGPSRTEAAGVSLKEIPVVRKLADDMEIAEIKAPVEAVAGAMLFIGVIGWFAVNGMVSGLRERFALDADKMIPTNTWLLNGFIAILIGSLPYFYVKFRLQRKRHRIALDMIKLVQNMIAHYSVGRTVQDIIARSSPTMPDHVRSEWKLLELQSHMRYSLEDALYEFARRVDNVWAEDLADILLIKHKYGNDVIDSLHKLVIDMQTARKNEEKRLAMVTVYRIGTVVMIAFAFFIVFFNIYADGMNYRHYFVNPMGKLALMISSAVMFVSMVMVVRSGRKTF
ncbi:type II secretion system F family protein [Paenibacillus alkalitolerans]|uniref:type II secretion system F family protein n=1 Tax=Paenibacillus alkalitolerans TaxID=2799335 RepID=UPI0018F350DC|nr:type II secretion system F family protein [Paenibacillus alkalitolerans]